MRLRLEERRVAVQPRAEILPAIGIEPLVFEQVSAGLDVALLLAEDARDEGTVKRFEDHVGAGVFVIDVHARIGFARGRQPHLGEHLHRDRLADQRGVAVHVVEAERLQPEELLVGDVAVDVDPQPGLGAIARGMASRADADIANGDAVPAQVRRIIGVLAEVVFQRLPVPRAHGQMDLLEDRIVEEVVLGR